MKEDFKKFNDSYHFTTNNPLLWNVKQDVESDLYEMNLKSQLPKWKGILPTDLVELWKYLEILMCNIKLKSLKAKMLIRNYQFQSLNWWSSFSFNYQCNLNAIYELEIPRNSLRFNQIRLKELKVIAWYELTLSCKTNQNFCSY